MKTLLFIFCLLCFDVSAFEMLVRATSNTHPDITKDRTGSWKRGMIVVVMPDGHVWGRMETLPTFVVIKVPMVSAAKAAKYLAQQIDVNGETYRRRLWQIRWADLPQAAKNKLAAGGLTIKATSDYTGPSDYTWTQIKTYFRNLETGIDETQDL